MGSIADDVCEYIDRKADWAPMPWQVELLRDLYEGEHQTAALSCARGNGKTEFCAGIAAAVIDPEGPLYQGSRSQVVVAVPKLALGIDTVLPSVCRIVGAPLRTSRKGAWRVSRQVGRPVVEHESGSSMVIIGSRSKGTAHGVAPQFLICDEPAQWGASGGALWSSATTSLGKVPNSKGFIIGTRHENKEHWFEKLLADKNHLTRVYSADPERPFDTWEQANPSLPVVPSRAVIEEHLARCDDSVHERHSFLALRCNLGTQEYEHLGEKICSVQEWELLPVADAHTSPPVVVGVDLGAAYSLTACVAVWADGSTACHVFIGDDPSINARELRDNAPGIYQAADERNELTVLPDVRQPPADQVLGWILDHWGHPQTILCDSWNWALMVDAARQLGIEGLMACRKRTGEFVHDDINRLRSGIELRTLSRPRSLMLDRAMMRAEIRTNAMGNKIAVKRPGDDPFAALLLAWGEYERRTRRSLGTIDYTAWIDGMEITL